MREFIYRNNKYGYMEKYEKTPYATCVGKHVKELLDFIYGKEGKTIEFYVFDWGSNKKPMKSAYEKLFGKPKEKSQLPFDSAVYMFYWPSKNIFLKIGKVSKGSAGRFYEHHYQKKGSNSTLSKSIEKSKKDEKCPYWNEFKIIPEPTKELRNPISNWIVENLERIDIVFPKDDRSFIAAAVESYFHAKCKPLFEGYKSDDDENQ